MPLSQNSQRAPQGESRKWLVEITIGVVGVAIALFAWLRPKNPPPVPPPPTPPPINLSASWRESIEGKDGGYVFTHQIGDVVVARHAAVGPAIRMYDLMGEAEKPFWEGELKGSHIQGKIHLPADTMGLYQCPKLSKEPTDLPMSFDLQSDGSLVGSYVLQEVFVRDCIVQTKRVSVKLIRETDYDDNDKPIPKASGH
jgi:hypothetical protein